MKTKEDNGLPSQARGDGTVEASTTTEEREEAGSDSLDAAKLRELALAGALAELASDDMGIYPRSVQGGPKPYEKRSDWMEGWNAALSAQIGKQSALSDWMSNLSDDSRPLVEDLILTERLRMRVDEGGEVQPWIICNDLFYWACADGEDIALEELTALVECCALSPRHGEALWVARKRGMRPQRPYYDLFSAAERALFDACGPERDE